MKFAADTGGTFTDLIVEDDSGGLRMFKSPTTPENPIQGILNAIQKAAESMSISVEELLGRGETFIHGTTHAINAIITGKTAKTALLTTKGHPDILVLREGGRSEPFNFRIPFPKPYIPRSLTFEISERITCDGGVLLPLNEDEVLEIINKLKKKLVQAVAVCFLWSTVNPSHEIKIGRILSEKIPGIYVTLSHKLNPILREYRRASSTAIDASLKPIMSKYLGELQGQLQGVGFKGRLLMLTSKGGVMEVKDLIIAPIHAIGSGPSMAPIAGKHFAELDSGNNTVIITDTGGTSYDVSLVREGTIPMTQETWIGKRFVGHIVGFPSVDVKIIGAGGGSIAWLDAGGLLHVGPASAGAVPGPACYAKGGSSPTVTDAAVVLGYINPDYFLGGSVRLDRELAEKEIKREIAKPLSIGLIEAASAIIRIATENMVGSIEQITIHQGIDPRTAVMVGAGGAAGLNSVAVARRLGCSKLIIPEAGAAFSALGAIISDLRSDYQALFYTRSDKFDIVGVNDILDSLIRKCQAFIEGPGKDSLEHSIEINCEARYEGQAWEIEVPVAVQKFRGTSDIVELREEFDRIHERLFTFRDLDSKVEFIGWRAAAKCKLSVQNTGRMVAEKEIRSNYPSYREVYFDKLGLVDSKIVYLEEMKPNEILNSPAIVESPFTTIVIEPNSRAFKSFETGSLIITMN